MNRVECSETSSLFRMKFRTGPRRGTRWFGSLIARSSWTVTPERKTPLPGGEQQLEENQLTQKQRKWLEASRRIGPGTMTKTERQSLEKLYTDMLPREQQELAAFIQEKFGKAGSQETDGDILDTMQRKVWNSPSSGLRSVLTKNQTSVPPKRRP